jgi:hypothetical protein
MDLLRDDRSTILKRTIPNQSLRKTEKKGFAGDVSTSRMCNSHPRLFDINLRSLGGPGSGDKRCSFAFSEQFDAFHVADIFVSCLDEFCGFFHVCGCLAYVIIILECDELCIRGSKRS